MGKEGAGKSKRVTGQRTVTCMGVGVGGGWEKTKRGGTEQGLHIGHAEDEKEITRREKKKERQKHRIFQEIKKAEVKTRMTGRREGIK